MNNKTKIKLIGIGIIIIAVLFIGIGIINNNNTKNTNTEKATLTKEKMEELQSDIFNTLLQNEFSSYYKKRILDGANARAESHLKETKNIEKYTDCKVTSFKQIDEYTLRVYGNLYGTDKFNNTITQQFYSDFYIKIYNGTESTYQDGFILNAED